ncbi:MAG: hypothetical protein A3F72_14270 [Bacteroidetes bacterium RIFCSPLOWO2_12_FULL_35_15]|nr:MAG: hypothetical protein A3F72_14270 [Bacteroidetes bacterium RIFCSPLOWO2_12_FULL_35_15]
MYIPNKICQFLFESIGNVSITKLLLQLSITNKKNKHIGRILILFSCFLFNEVNSNAADFTSTSIGGIWSAGTTWIGGNSPCSSDNAIIATTSGNSVTLSGVGDITNLKINSGAIFYDGGNSLSVSGNIIINGTYLGNGLGSVLAWKSNNSTIDGSGIINNVEKILMFPSTNKTILSTANLTFTGANQCIEIGPNSVVTNNGIVTIKKIFGTGGGWSEWINSVNALLNVSESLLESSTDILTATATGNIVNYYGSIAQTMKATSYYHLKYSGTNTGTLAGNINIAGDFTASSGTFNSSTFTTTFNGNVAQNIYGTQPVTFYNLTLNNTFSTIPQFTLNTDVTTQKELIMTKGVVNISGNTFTLGVNATTSTLTRVANTTTNWMYGGTFKRFWLTATTITSTSGDYYGLFPMGTMNASSYRPVQLNSSGNITTAGFFTVNHMDVNALTNLNPVYNDAGTDIKRIHNSQFITAITGVTAGTFSISATMTNLVEGSLSDIRLAIFTGGTTASAVGTHSSATGTAQNPTAKRTGITTLANLNNDFRISTTDILGTPLPIQLLNFEAMPSGNIIEIKWTTASETNNDYFTIEKSKDGLNFETVSSVDGAGNSATVINYKLQDYQPFDGHSYYRLNQTDFDGTVTHSHLVNANFNRKPDFSFKIYPNPNDGVCINLDMIAERGKETHLVMSDINGKEIYSKEIIINSNEENVYTFCSEERLAPGIYFVKISSSNKEYTKKIIVE